mgnify:CR=1 FL=1
MEYSFGKDYKLCHEKQIESLYSNAAGTKHYPYIIKVEETSFNEDVRFKAVISTPKRTNKSAVKRNKIKRLTRESLRLNKAILEKYLTSNNKQISLFIIYTSKDVLSFELLNKKMVHILNAIVKNLESTNIN